jgi:hypothetical protein
VTANDPIEELPIEVNEADAIEQHQEVPIAEEDDHGVPVEDDEVDEVDEDQE